MSDQPSSTDAATIPRDLPCVRCGYNLRGTPEDHGCPECGLPVAQSKIERRWLWAADPGWVKKIWWGSLLLAVGYGARFLYVSAFVLTGMAAPRGYRGFERATGAWWIISSLAEGLGAWLLASREHVQGPRVHLRVIALILGTMYCIEGIYFGASREEGFIGPLMDAACSQMVALGVPNVPVLFIIATAGLSILQTIMLYRLGRSLTARLNQSRIEGMGALAQVCLAVNAGFVIIIFAPGVFETTSQAWGVFFTCGGFFLVGTWLPAVLAGVIFWSVLAREIRRPSRRVQVQMRG